MILEQNMILTKEVSKLLNRLADLEDRLYSKSKLTVFGISKK